MPEAGLAALAVFMATLATRRGIPWEVSYGLKMAALAITMARLAEPRGIGFEVAAVRAFDFAVHGDHRLRVRVRVGVRVRLMLGLVIGL